jgi:hypothetical protein
MRGLTRAAEHIEQRFLDEVLTEERYAVALCQAAAKRGFATARQASNEE